MKFLVLLLLSIWWVGCSENKVSGTATDTENTLAGVVFTSKDSYAVGAKVLMLSRHASYGENPLIAETETDSVGSFEFPSVEIDSFDLEIKLFDEKGNLREMATYRDLCSRDSSLGILSLGLPVVLKGHFNYEEHVSDITVGSAFKFSVSGSSLQTSIFALDSFQISTVPGEIQMAFYPSDNQVVERLFALGFESQAIYQEFSFTAKEGDTLDVGELKWVLGEKEENPWDEGSLLVGRVLDEEGNPVKGAEVRVIRDVYGLAFALSGTPSAYDYVYSDDSGFWSMPFPAEVLADSFRVEAEIQDSIIGVSSFIPVADLVEYEGDTLEVEPLVLDESSAINLNIRLIVNQEDSTQIDNCYMNSVVVGLVGTSKFKQIVTCAPADLLELPSGEHSFVFYSSDAAVLKVLQERDVPMESYMRFIDVTLTPGEVLYHQGITYTPPTL